MGRNGTNPSAFPRMIRLINDNVGNILTSEQILLGAKPNCRSVETNYLYKFIKLGYLEKIGKKTTDPSTTYKVLKAFPRDYTSVMFVDELRIVNGKAPKYPRN
ncbi:MAG: hypothetical protein K2G70_05895 [Turicibacter sp.]|nr:hypothetical protein [Turicibacter sp.]